MIISLFIKKHIIAILIFFFSLIIGLFVYKDYGISWDEKEQRNIGLQSYNFVLHGDNSLKTYDSRDYGVAFELPLIIIERTLHLKDSREIFLMRHLVTHVFFLLSAFIFYLLIYLLYRNRILGIFGYLVLLLSPAIYAHSFYNTKDIPCMCMFIICFFLLEVAFQKWKATYFLLFGICTGLLINIRIMGVMFILFATVFMIADKFILHKKKIGKFYLIYIISSLTILIVSWPYLWENPIGNFISAFSRMSKFNWDGSVLMFGEFIKGTDIKWYYIPFWFSVTTPIPLIIAGLTGSIFLIINIIKKPVKFFSDNLSRTHLMYLLCFFGSIFIVIFLHSVLYDGWRQMYFIYPSFILLGIYGISFLFKIKNKQYRLYSTVPVIAIIAITFIHLSLYMVRNHPFQNVYFNNLLSHDEQYLRKNFEMDYWGASYKQAFEYMLDNDKSCKINVAIAQTCGYDNAMILKKDNRERIIFVDKTEDAGYFISDYRSHPNDYDYNASKKVFNVKILNSDVISVWKLK